jgi:2-oxoglutarate dehydrogenase E2 component (dihydrolipoamide succinyltransferase)
MTDILMFSEQKEGTESFVGSWLKKPGEHVSVHEPVVEISTDKVTMEIAAPESGVLSEILKAEGERIEPGDVLGRIEGSVEGSGPAEAAPAVFEKQQPLPVAPTMGSNAGLTPAVRRLLDEHKLDPASIPATGRGGRLTHQDVLDFLARTPVKKSRMVPHTAMRRSIASQMTRGLQAAPHVTAVFEADLSRAIADRDARKASSPDAGEVPTMTAYLIRAAVAALKVVPEANARWNDDALEIFENFNIGVGTATEDGGLIVPVIHRAQDLSLIELSGRLRELTTRARSGALTPEDVREGTFTISNHGVSGSLLAAPIIIPHSQTAILGAGKLQKRAVVIEADGKNAIAIRPMMYVTLTIDHRALDGQQTNAFLSAFVRALETGSE